MDVNTFWNILFIVLICGLTFGETQKTPKPPRFKPDSRNRLSRTTVPDYYLNAGGKGRPNINVTPRSFLEDNYLNFNGLQECDLLAGRHCNVTNAERCVFVRERAPHCVCMPGHLRSPDGQTCTAVKSFRFQLPTLIPYDAQLGKRTSKVYRDLEYQIKDMVFKAVHSSNLTHIAQDVNIREFLLPKDGYATFDLEIYVSRSFSPTVTMVQHSLRAGLQSLLTVRGNGVYLDDTMIMVDPQMVKGIEVTDPDPCEDPLLNYCNKMAHCFRTERSFSCRCLDNYQDVSPEKLRFPGEECRVQCNCANQGVCNIEDNGQKICQCTDWWFGSRCEINGKALLIAFFLVLALLLVFAIALCTCCFCNDEKKKLSSSVPSTDKSKSMESVRNGGLDVLHVRDPFYAPKGSYRPYPWHPSQLQPYDMYLGTYNLPRLPLRAPLSGLPQLTWHKDDFVKSGKGHGSQLKRSQVGNDF